MKTTLLRYVSLIALLAPARAEDLPPPTWRFEPRNGRPTSLVWETVEGQDYDLFQSNDLIAWERVTGFPVAGAGQPLTHPLQPSTQAYFRIVTRPTEPWRTICTVGTSITDGASNRLDGSDGAGARLRFMPSFPPAYLRPMLGQKISLSLRDNSWAVDSDHGYSGATLLGLLKGSEASSYIAEGLIPVRDAINTGADAFILEGGTNDRTLPPATILARMHDYWNYFRSRDKPVVAMNILPVGPANGPVIRDTIAQVNAALPALAAKLGVILIDTYSLAEIDDQGYATPTSSRDGIHPQAAYAAAIAKALADRIRPHTVQNTAFPIPPTGDERWLTPNQNPSQNSQPSGWTYASPGTEFTAVTDTDGTRWQRVALNNSLWLYGHLSTGFSPGEKVRMTAKIRLVDQSATGAMRVCAYFYNGTGIFTSALYAGSDTFAGSYPTGEEWYFITDEATIPTGTTMVRWEILFYGDIRNRKSIADIRDIGLFKTD